MKKTVYTVTPNPALDLGGSVNGLVPNEKSYVENPQKYPGGNAVNAARILQRMNIPVICTGFLGGSTGEEFQTLLARESIKCHFVKIQESTRINVTVSNLKDHNQTRLTFPGPHIQRADKQDLLNFIKHKQGNISQLVIGGSLPPGFTPSDVTSLVSLAKRAGAQVVVDCPGGILKNIISSRPFLIKPNLTEFQQLAGKKTQSIKSVIREAQKMLPLIDMLCISSVQGGTLLVTREGNYFGKIAPVKIRSTVGAGDSMVGAMVAQLYKKNQNAADILKWGLAAAAATLSKTGTSLGDNKDIHRLYKKTIVERL